MNQRTNHAHESAPDLPQAAENFSKPTSVPGAEEDGVNNPSDSDSPTQPQNQKEVDHRESIEGDDSDAPDGSGPGTEADRSRNGRGDV